MQHVLGSDGNKPINKIEIRVIAAGPLVYLKSLFE